MEKYQEFEAISTLVGSVIGAGVLGMPYAIAKAGLLNGIIVLLLLGGVVTLIYLYYGEVILRTKEVHQLTGYAAKYLGKSGRIIATFSMVFSVYGALVVYTLGVGSSFVAIFGGNSLLFSLGFFVFCSLLIYIGIRAVERSEPLLMVCVVSLLLIIFFFCLGKINTANLVDFNPGRILVPYGVVLFALLGTTALPEMREELVGREKLFKRSIIIGMLIPIVLYLLFSFAVVGVIGLDGFLSLDANNRIATVALVPYLGAHMAFFGNLFAIFAMTTSFLAIGLSLKEMFVFDFKLGIPLSLGLTLVPPLILAVSNYVTFMQIMETLGIVIGGISGLLIVLMFWKAKKYGDRKPEYTLPDNRLVGIVLFLLFAVGAIYSLFMG